MSQEPERSVSRSDLDEVLADYMRRVDRGEHVEPEELITAHPDLADELRECFSQATALDRLISAVENPAQKSLDNMGGVSGKTQQIPTDLQSSSTLSDQSATQPQVHSVTPSQDEGALPAAWRVGPYEILGVLGEGGYGVVYLAKDVDLERSVAIKLAKRGNSQSTDQVRTFLGEARRVAQLRHPSIVNIFDVSRGDSDPWYLVMEYIEGPSLAEVYKEGELSIVALIDLLVHVADAIQYAHSNGILHRDLKPANVLLDKKERHPRIVDFGMALHEREQSYAPRYPAGTPYCMSPEQVRGETHRLDARTDIWSLAVMMYEGLTGKRPFTGENVRGVFDAILQDDPQPLSQINPCVPSELERICLKCLSKRMGDRYATAAELAIELRRWLKDSADNPAKPLSVTDSGPAVEVASQALVVPKGLRSFSSEDAGFFLDLLPGPHNRDGLPESISMWINAIENPERRPEKAALVLYGPTGSGKSSFVRAGLVPRLRSSTSTICVDSATGDLERHILRSLHHVCPDLPARVELVQACSLIRTGSAPRFEGKVLLVLDQFEQWLHANNSCLSGELAMALRQCDGERLQCLMVVRSDFWLGITRFLRELEVPLIEGSNSAHLDLFDIRHARRVLTAFGRSYGCLPPADAPLRSEHRQFLEQAAEQIAADGWVVPVRLALFAEMMKGQEWTVETLRKLGGERGLRVAFLDQVFASPLAAPSHRRYRKPAEAILRALLPETGVELKGRCRTEFELKQASGFANKEERFAELMEILDSQLRLITPTEDVEVHDRAADGYESSVRIPTGRPSYQLTHDYLVPALREWLTREQQSTAAGRARLCLEERDRQWRQTQDVRYLPSLSEIVRICTLTDRKLWNDSQRSMIRKAAARNVRQLIVLIFTVATLSILFSTLYFATQPDPLAIFQDSSLSAQQRMEAFDRLDLSSVAELGPVIYTIKREHQPEVLRHAIDGMYEYVENMRAASGTGVDNARDLIRSEWPELLGREEIIGGKAEDEVRAKLFSIYASLAPSPDVLQFVADAYERNRPLGKRVLIQYLSAVQPDVMSQVSIGTVTNLVRLMDTLPPGEERSLAAGLLARVPSERLVELFMASFVGKPYQYAERSLEIYVKALPTEARRKSEARRLLGVMGGKLARLLKDIGQDEISGDELEYVLASIQHLQPQANFWDPELFDHVRSVFPRRNEFPDTAVVDVACAAYATLYVTSPQAERGDLSDLAPLQEIVSGREENTDFRCAAANALATIDQPVLVSDLAAIATSASEPMRLRTEAIVGLGSVGRRRHERNADSREIVDVLVKLFDTEKYQSSDLLADIVGEIAAFGTLDELTHVLSVLPRRHFDLNLHVQDAVFAFLIRNPHMAEQIAEQTLIAIVGLSDEEREALYPSPEQFLADIMRLRYSYDHEVFGAAYRRLVAGLANLSAGHESSSVRGIAHQNLNQLPFVDGLPDIDPNGSKQARDEQIAQWHKKWSEVEGLLRFEDELHSEVR